MSALFWYVPPISVIMASMMLLCAFIVRGGIEVMGRAAELFVPVFIFSNLYLNPFADSRS
ncbi:hypothetical protein RCO48_38055 [Peribacillus frigoritolerans]|nr:hypothetical protein [Peribacillus frigoritolerans]